MYNIEIHESNGKFTFVFHGAINSTNADEINDFLSKNIEGKTSVSFDFNDVDYLSSVGLRIVLKIGKAIPDFEVINVNNDVYSIFDMTGFTQILKIQKSMREVSIEGKELVGEGYMGRVYRLDPETIIKVYYRNSTLDDIKREISLAKTAFVLGIPTAIPFEVVKVKEGSYGSIFELLNSSCFNKLFINHPEKTEEYIDRYIDLLKQLISIRAKPDCTLPKKIDDANTWYNGLVGTNVFTPEIMSKMRKLIDTIPDENHVIHGDYHIKNIMMQGDEPLLIDMDTLGTGHEIFEFTAFYLSYLGYPNIDHNNAMEFLGIPYETAEHIFNRSIEEIFNDRSQEERDLIVDKIKLLGYFWLAYKTLMFEPENKKRLDNSVEEVTRLIDKIDTLAF